MIGKNLHADAGGWQDLAQFAPGPKTRLANRTACDTVQTVTVVRPLRALTGSLNRYPFPDGRRAFPPSAPPIFSFPAVMQCDHKRSFAQTASVSVSPSIGTIRVQVSLTSQSYSEEGSKLCRLPNGWWAPHALLRSRPAVTHRLNRAYWVRAQVPVQRSSSMVTRSPARSSVAQPTCFTVSRTPAAANPVAGQRLRLKILSKSNHRTLRSGGFLLSDAGLSASPSAGCRPCHQEKEGT